MSYTVGGVAYSQMKRLDELLERGYEVTVNERLPLREFYSHGFFSEGLKVHPLFLSLHGRPEYKEYVCIRELWTPTGFIVDYQEPDTTIIWGEFTRDGRPTNQDAREILRILGLS